MTNVTGIKIVTLVFLSLVLVLAGTLYLAGMGAERTVFSSAYYHGLMQEVNLSFHLQTMIEQSILEMGDDDPEGPPPQALEVMAEAITSALDPDWIEEHVLLVVDDALALIKGHQNYLTAVIDLEAPKERLAANLASGLESLAPDVLEEMGMDPEMIGDQAGFMVEEMDFPDRLELSELLAEGDGLSKVEEVVPQIQRYRGYLQIFVYAVFGAIFLACWGLAGLPGGLKWSGASVIISGVVFLCGLMGAQGLVSIRLAEAGEIPLDPQVLVATAEYTVGRLYTVPIVYTAVGLVMLTTGIVGGKILRRKQD